MGLDILVDGATDWWVGKQVVDRGNRLVGEATIWWVGQQSGGWGNNLVGGVSFIGGRSYREVGEATGWKDDVC